MQKGTQAAAAASAEEKLAARERENFELAERLAAAEAAAEAAGTRTTTETVNISQKFSKLY